MKKYKIYIKTPNGIEEHEAFGENCLDAYKNFCKDSEPKSNEEFKGICENEWEVERLRNILNG